MARQKKCTISKALRFEVFKRDSFKCQYCGKCAPDVILHADHIHPESKGGTTDIINLITACEACNLGKAATPLSDSTAAAKARTQLEALQERREQLDMMMQWQHGLRDLESETATQCARFFESLGGNQYSLNETGLLGIQKLLRTYNVGEVLDAMRISTRYFRQEKEQFSKESVADALSKIGSICSIARSEKDQPELKDLFYCRGIVRNRCNYFSGYECMDILRAAFDAGVPIEVIKRECKQVSSWTDFQSRLGGY